MTVFADVCFWFSGFFAAISLAYTRRLIRRLRGNS